MRRPSLGFSKPEVTISDRLVGRSRNRRHCDIEARDLVLAGRNMTCRNTVCQKFEPEGCGDQKLLAVLDQDADAGVLSKFEPE
jgi:hypothetical protein